MASILQDWVAELGLRHQGVLLSAIRGCDSVRKDDPSKSLTQVLRGEILNAHCGDASKASSFIKTVDNHEFVFYVAWPFVKSMDHYPMHYLMHLIHAAQILGYYHPDVHSKRQRWNNFYKVICNKLHLNPETKEQLDDRLNADEDVFKTFQD